MGLTNFQISRQDYVDNKIHELIEKLSDVDIRWDIEDIGAVRDVLQHIIVNKLELMTEQEFYPFIVLCNCESCKENKNA